MLLIEESNNVIARGRVRGRGANLTICVIIKMRGCTTSGLQRHRSEAVPRFMPSAIRIGNRRSGVAVDGLFLIDRLASHRSGSVEVGIAAFGFRDRRRFLRPDTHLLLHRMHHRALGR